MIKIRAFGRIHTGLISLHEKGYRKFGGVGFSIKEPFIDIRAIAISKGIEITDSRVSCLNEFEQKRLSSIVEKALHSKGILGGVALDIRGGLIPHVGLGAGTALTLAAIEASLILYKAPYERDELIRFSGRGGTSGLGVNLYFSGGASIDLGHIREETDWLPSSFQRGGGIPLLLSNVSMPLWPITIILPKNMLGKHGTCEKEFFAANLPIDKEDSFYMCYHSVFGLFSSIVAADMLKFMESVRAIQKSKWKEMEANLNMESSFLIRDINLNKFLGAGLSSMGPAIYMLNGGGCIEQPDGFDFINTSAINSGRVIEYA